MFFLKCAFYCFILFYSIAHSRIDIPVRNSNLATIQTQEVTIPSLTPEPIKPSLEKIQKTPSMSTPPVVDPFGQILKIKKLIPFYQVLSDPHYPRWNCKRSFSPRSLSPSEILTLKEQLFRIGYLNNKDMIPAYNQNLFHAIQNLQKNLKRQPNGLIDQTLCTFLNQSTSYIFGKMKENLERWETMIPFFREKFLFVNIPNYYLYGVQNNKIDFSSRVIVGRPERPTPLFSTDMNCITANPSWTVPVSIFLKDKLTKVRSNPSYLTHKRYLVYDRSGSPVSPHRINWHLVSKAYFPYRIRQLPGKNNALGVLKFHLDTPYSIYMHDNPNKKLFYSPSRAFSSGCIRVEKPFELAAWCLNQERKKTILLKHIGSGNTHSLSLSPPLKVIVGYITLWIGENNRPILFEDPYELDRES